MSVPQASPAVTERLLRVSEVESIVGLGKSTIYGRVRCNTFPQPVRFSRRATRWTLSSVSAWIAEQTSAGPK